VNKPGDALDGFVIGIPEAAYTSGKSFKISYAPITKQTFGDLIKPVSPLITIENGGDYSEKPVYIRVPVKVPDGYFAMGFYYEKNAGQLEGMPLAGFDAESVTLCTSHFSDFFVSIAPEELLKKDINSDFEPGKDDWQFVNNGSCITDGHCMGQSMAAMWYYLTKPDGAKTHLYGQYDNNGKEPKTPDLWQDDSLGYRLCSAVQKDEDITFNTKLENLAGVVWKKVGGEWKYTTNNLGVGDAATWYMFAYSMLTSKQPQMVAVLSNTGSYHALICYRINQGNLYIADPNYPGKTDRRIEYSNGTFKPYNSGANREEIDAGRGESFEKIIYFGNWSMVANEQIAKRWTELKSGTVANDLFPRYNIYFIEGNDPNPYQLTDNEVFTSKKVLFDVYLDDIVPLIYRDGKLLPSDAEGNTELVGGKNNLGFLVMKKVGTKWKYVDFKYVTVIYNELTVNPNPLDGETGKEYVFTANMDSPPAGVKYEWYVNNELKQSSPQNTFKTSFSAAGNYTVSVWAGAGGIELGKDEAKVTIKAGAPVSTGYWQYKSTWQSEIKKVDPVFTGQTSEATLSDGTAHEVMKLKDHSVPGDPWIEFTYDFGWIVSAKNGNFKDKLYAGDEVSIKMDLNYKGVDPAKLSGSARMYCGAFDSYPKENLIEVSNPGGSGSKTVTIPVIQGYGKGATAFIKVHCGGGYQSFEFAYLYEWVPAVP
jgi:hypothetical protein